jgi:DUF1365 family protein
MNPAITTSSLYECTVLHERFTPKHHRFVYRLFYFAFDLDELVSLPRRLTLFSVNRANLFSFREKDFLPTGEPLYLPTFPDENSSATANSPLLKSRVRAFCAAHQADFGADGRVLLITLPRVLGYLFNPVSFYFCYNAGGILVGAIIEVTNTFREVKPYFIPPVTGPDGAITLRLRTLKHFYVSPFSELDLVFDFTLHAPVETLAVQIDDHAAGSRVLHTSLTGIRAPITNLRLTWFLLKYPLITLKIITLIHWQALCLWSKRVPYFAKAADATDQRDLYRPHSSIKRAPST